LNLTLTWLFSIRKEKKEKRTWRKGQNTFKKFQTWWFVTILLWCNREWTWVASNTVCYEPIMVEIYSSL